jgi:hypothetical protein
MWVKLVTHDTRHAAVQRTSDMGATETEESITRGEDQEARGIGQSTEPHTDLASWAQYVCESSSIKPHHTVPG